MNRSLIGFLAFVVALVLAVGVVLPKAGEVKNDGVDEQARKAIAESYATRIEALTQLKQVFDSNTATVDSLVAVLPQTPEIPETLVSIEAMAKANGVNLQTVVPQVDKLKQQVSVTLTGDGELAAVEGLLNAIADNNRPISLSTVSMVKSADGKRVNVTLGLAFPFRDAKSPVKGASS